MRNHKRSFLLFKRIFDISLSSAGLVLSLPASIIIVILILLEDGPPIFFCDRRIGLNGRVFKVIKFRSMVKDAEKKTGSIYAVKHDPRVTPVGRLLRAAALDELPQLINILKGDMSFVGPRPEKENYVEVFNNSALDYRARHAIRPGLTGPAQVYLKYDSNMEKKLEYDLAYVNEANFMRDILLIARSFMITFKAGWEKFEGCPSGAAAK